MNHKSIPYHKASRDTHKILLGKKRYDSANVHKSHEFKKRIKTEVKLPDKDYNKFSKRDHFPHGGIKSNELRKKCKEYEKFLKDNNNTITMTDAHDESVININSFDVNTTSMQLDSQIQHDLKIENMLRFNQKYSTVVKVFDKRTELEIILIHTNNSPNKDIDNIYIMSYITLSKIKGLFLLVPNHTVQDSMKNVTAMLTIQPYNPQKEEEFIKGFKNGGQIAIVQNWENIYLLFHFSNEFMKLYTKSECEFYLIKIDNADMKEMLEEEIKKNGNEEVEDRWHTKQNIVYLSVVLEEKEKEISSLKKQIEDLKNSNSKEKNRNMDNEASVIDKSEMNKLKEKYKKLRDIAEIIKRDKQALLQENENLKKINSYLSSCKSKYESIFEERGIPYENKK